MEFEPWVNEVKQTVSSTRNDVRPDEIDPNAMYQAFANGVSSETFATAKTIPTKRPNAPSSPLQKPPIPVPPTHADAPPTLFASMHPQAVPHSSTNPVKDRLNAPVKVEYLLAGVIVLFVIAFGVCNSESSAPNAASRSRDLSNEGPNGTVSSSPSAPPPKPLSDQQNIDKAKVILSTWKGSQSDYDTAMTCLENVPASSKLHAKALNLKGAWAKRKAQADSKRAKEEKLAELRREKDARQAEADQLKAERAEEKYFTGDEDTQVAVPRVELHRSTQNYVAGKNGTFVYLLVAVKNTGSSPIHANPNDFTLSDSDGNTSSHDTDTYSLSNYFNAVDLNPGQQTDGWLIFSMRKDKKYVLTRHGGLSGSTVEKTVIP